MNFRRNTAANFAMYLTVIVGIFLLSSVSNFAQAKSDAKLAKQAKISMAKARKIALTKEPNGKIEDAELEKEHGKLVYSFDIRNPKGTITEVQVNAKTGKIVSVEEEDKKAEAKEKQEEMREKAKKPKKN